MTSPCDEAPGPSPVVIRSGQNEAAFRARILDYLSDGVYFVDLDRRITYWNRGAERLTGFSAEEVVGTYCFDNLLAHINAKGCHLCIGGCPLSVAIDEDRFIEHFIYLRHKQGHRVPVSVRAMPMKNEQGEIVGAVEVFSDSTLEKITERRIGELETIAFRDSLTGLPNRRYIGLKVHQALEEVQDFGRPFGLALLDIDHFKRVNDSWGHGVGDAVLRTIADTLSRSLRANDIVGRWGGEEFLAIVADVSAAALEEIAERWRHLIAESSVAVQDRQIRVTVSIGVTLLSGHDVAETAIERADRLMYQSKVTRNKTTLG